MFSIHSLTSLLPKNESINQKMISIIPNSIIIHLDLLRDWTIDKIALFLFLLMIKD
jgi:hypothetical protein